MSPLAILSRAGILSAVLALCAPAAAAAQAQLQFSLTLYDQPDYRGASVTFYGDNANIGSTGFADRARSAQVRGVWRLCEGGGFRNRCEVLSANVRDLDAVGFSGRVGSAQRLSGALAAAPLPAPPPARYAQPYAPELPAPYGPPPAQYAPAPYAAPAMPYGAAPAYAAPYAPAPAYPSRPYEPQPDYTPPAVDAPVAAPGRFGPAPYAPPAAAPAYAPGAQGQDPVAASTAVFFPAPTLRGADVAAWTPRAADGFCRAQGLGAALYFDQSQRLPRAVDVDGRAVGEGPVLRDVLCRR